MSKLVRLFNRLAVIPEGLRKLKPRRRFYRKRRTKKKF